MIIYISGAIQNDRDFMAKFEAAEIDIKDAGHMPINPAKFISNIHGLSEQQAMDICYQLLSMADAIYLLPDWSTSLSCNQEVGFARARNMKFITPESMVTSYQN